MTRIILAVLASAMAAAVVAVVPLRPRDPLPEPAPAWSDLQNKCRYIVVDLSPDGLEIAITGDGASICARRIFVNGMRSIPERRI